MTTSAAASAATVRHVATGTQVIAWNDTGTLVYGGEPESGVEVVKFDIGSGVTATIECAMHKVAPADTPVPSRDDRVTVTRCAKGTYPTWQGPWLLRVAGQPHTGIRVPHPRLTIGKFRSMVISDGEAYNAELLWDGRPVGAVENGGTGGPTTWFPLAGGSFGPREMGEFVAACRNDADEPMVEEFVLAELFEEARAAKLIARYLRQSRTPIRTRAAIVNGDDTVVGVYTDAYCGLPLEQTLARPALDAWAWLRWPGAHAIEMWSGSTWDPLSKRAAAR